MMQNKCQYSKVHYLRKRVNSRYCTSDDQLPGYIKFAQLANMGFDVYPQLVYGIRISDVHINDQYIGCTLVDNSRHGGFHILGITTSFSSFKRGFEDEQVKKYGQLMKKHFGIKCHYIMAVFTETENNCYADSISSQEFVHSLKPEWSDEKCWEVVKEFAEVTDYNSEEVQMEKFEGYECGRYYYADPTDDTGDDSSEESSESDNDSEESGGSDIERDEERDQE